MSEKTILVWFRNDLRVHDNEILLEATRKADKVLPVYCFDPFYFKTTTTGGFKTGNFRARFQLESVADLRQNLRSLGGELMVRTGNPAEIIPQLAEQYQVSEVYHHREVAYEETAISEQVEAALWKLKLNLKHFIGHTLYHKEDLPFPIKDIPDSFNTFKKKIERDSSVHACLDTPDRVNTPVIIDAGELPALHDLGLEEPTTDPREIFHFTGGETSAINQLKEYLIKTSQINASKTNRSASGSYNPSMLSPWLAFGCLSPRRVYWEVKAYENNGHGANDPIILDLLWRDYFRFMFKKHGMQFFKPEGFKDLPPATVSNQDELFEKWKSGQTGAPYIDATMRQLNAVGYISNHQRQIVANYLIKELKVDWTRGATYFEEKLIDYSPASNWGNWAFVAGVGNDPHENRYFNQIKQSAGLETNSEFINTWLPNINAIAEKLTM